MCGDSITEVTSQSWGGRITESIKGVLFGLLLFVISFPLLFWNEGRAVRRYRDLKEGRGNVAAVDPAAVNNATDGKLVHLSGQAKTDEVLKDDGFGIAINAVRLRRKVQMYQWEEEQEKKTEKKLGGGTRTVTTYRYHKTWSDRAIDHSGFHKPEDHENPGEMPVENQTQNAKLVEIGAYRLSPELIRQVSNFEAVPATAETAEKLSTGYKDKVRLSGSMYYLGADSSNPQIGDCKISFDAARPAVVSVIAGQKGDSFTGWTTSSGRTLEQRLMMGSKSAGEMFTQMEKENRILTWILRLVGVVLMFVGITLIFRPLVVVADVVPFIGSLIGGGVALFAGLVSLALTLLTIALGWVAYRPLVGIPLLILSAGCILLLVQMKRKKKAAALAADSP